jgi:eukaryotic-like serine/threonine-protein kinase
MFSLSLKSRIYQLALTVVLVALTYLASLFQWLSDVEYDLFLYVLKLRPKSTEGVLENSILFAPQWAVLSIYVMVMIIYVRKYSRAKTTAVFFLTISIIIFLLLMLEVLVATFFNIYLPVLLSGLIMLLVSFVYWLLDIYRRLIANVITCKDVIELESIVERMDKGELKAALIMLKECEYSDDLLEIGYRLGMMLETNKNWASALNLYHWLSRYDPGLSDFVDRVEEIRKVKAKAVVKPLSESKKLESIGDFKIIKRIAKGATAIVYEAIDQRTQKSVALKVMDTTRIAKNEMYRIDHWLREAEIVAQFEHKNIVAIHDARRYDNYVCIAMEYISGYAMAQRLRRREYITVGECLRISKSVLSALVVAHQHGVIHGDIKPANILYSSKRHTYFVTDFGAAYFIDEPQRKDYVIVGTPSYMSPEQLQGKKMDGRSDLFSLASTLFHLLSGKPPFIGSNLPELRNSIVNDVPELDHWSIPLSLKEVLLKALQKKTYMRFADAQQMLASIEYCDAQLQSRIKEL